MELKKRYIDLDLEIDEKTTEEIKQAAALNGVSVSQFVNDSLSAYIIKEREREINNLKNELKRYKTIVDKLSRLLASVNNVGRRRKD